MFPCITAFTIHILFASRWKVWKYDQIRLITSASREWPLFVCFRLCCVMKIVVSTKGTQQLYCRTQLSRNSRSLILILLTFHHLRWILYPCLCGFHDEDDYKEIWHMNFYHVTNYEHDMEKLPLPRFPLWQIYNLKSNSWNRFDVCLILMV